jgi:polyferredoxin
MQNFLVVFFFGWGGGGNPHLFVLLSMHGGQMGAIEIRECFILRVFFLWFTWFVHVLMPLYLGEKPDSLS